ncbi:MAG: hypothetical protein IKZ34_00145, partial [Alphaproteobacteria bacterium]|nr:hypothetical protein [Alphaproteobacteria bacterium]
MSKKHLRSAVQNTAYHQLTTQINNTVFQEYGFRYLNGDEKAGQWRTQVPYFPELEEKLARQIQVYLNTIPNPADAKNP